MRCYRRKGGFVPSGNPAIDTDRVRIHEDGRFEYVKADGRAVPAKDAEGMSRYARCCVGDGLWVVCEDEPLDRSKR